MQISKSRFNSDLRLRFLREFRTGEATEVRRNLSPSQRDKNERGEGGVLCCADGGRGRLELFRGRGQELGRESENRRGVVTGRGVVDGTTVGGGLNDIRLFVSESPFLTAAEAVLTGAPIDDICLRHPAQRSCPLMSSCILFV